MLFAQIIIITIIKITIRITTTITIIIAIMMMMMMMMIKREKTENAFKSCTTERNNKTEFGHYGYLVLRQNKIFVKINIPLFNITGENSK